MAAHQPGDTSAEFDDIQFNSQVLALGFHPSSNVLACGRTSGNVSIYKYASEGNTHVAELHPHDRACRALEFSSGGSDAVLYTVSSDRSVCAISAETGRVVWRQKHAHREAINTLKVMGEGIVATGDDGGVVKIWDTRDTKSLGSYKAHTDYITSLVPAKGKLVAASGDGRLSVMSWRKGDAKPVRSDDVDDELLSMQIVTPQGGSAQVVCGQNSGIGVFRWGEWLNFDYRFATDGPSVDSMVAIDDSIVMMGCGDGVLRVIRVHHTCQCQFLGVIGNHEEDLPIEALALSGDSRVIASTSHDSIVKLWDIGFLHEAVAESGDTTVVDDSGDAGAGAGSAMDEDETGDAIDAGAGASSDWPHADSDDSDADAEDAWKSKTKKKKRKGKNKKRGSGAVDVSFFSGL